MDVRIFFECTSPYCCMCNESSFSERMHSRRIRKNRIAYFSPVPFYFGINMMFSRNDLLKFLLKHSGLHASSKWISQDCFVSYLCSIFFQRKVHCWSTTYIFIFLQLEFCTNSGIQVDRCCVNLDFSLSHQYLVMCISHAKRDRRFCDFLQSLIQKRFKTINAGIHSFCFWSLFSYNMWKFKVYLRQCFEKQKEL